MTEMERLKAAYYAALDAHADARDAAYCAARAARAAYYAALAAQEKDQDA